MDVRELRMFVAVAEEGSIRGGARRMTLAQPYLSQCLRRLERKLGADLFVRSCRGITLTAAGEILLAEARDILARLDRVALAVRETAAARQTIRIGLISGRVAAAELTGPIITTFRSAHPELDIEVHELSFADQFDAVTSAEVDVALVRPPAFDERLTVQTLFSEPRVLCMSRDHELADASSLPVQDFVEEPFVELIRPVRQWADFWLLDGLRGDTGPTHPDGAVTLSELQVTLLCEDVVMTASASAWRLGMSHPMLRAVPIEDAPPSEVAVALREGDNRSAVLAFAECAREVSAEMVHLVPGGMLAG